jgi:ribosomal-protein-alanine N-acetyltransferase
MPHTIVLETERLILRHFTPDDLDDLAAIYADPDVMRYIGSGATKTREETVKVLEFAFIDNARAWPDEVLARKPQLRRAIERECSFGLWATIYKPDHKLIGRCGLLSWDLDGREETEVGYVLAKAYWGRGIATEAARASRDYAFEKLGFDRLISLILPQNAASQRVAIKNGMSYERDVAVGEIPVVHMYSVRRDSL